MCVEDEIDFGTVRNAITSGIALRALAPMGSDEGVTTLAMQASVVALHPVVAAMINNIGARSTRFKVSGASCLPLPPPAAAALYAREGVFLSFNEAKSFVSLIPRGEF